MTFRSVKKKFVKTSSDPDIQIAPQSSEVVKVVGAQTIKLEEAVEENTMGLQPDKIDSEKNRYPYCIVWTPIPFLT